MFTARPITNCTPPTAGNADSAFRVGKLFPKSPKLQYLNPAFSSRCPVRNLRSRFQSRHLVDSSVPFLRGCASDLIRGHWSLHFYLIPRQVHFPDVSLRAKSHSRDSANWNWIEIVRVFSVRCYLDLCGGGASSDLWDRRDSRDVPRGNVTCPSRSNAYGFKARNWTNRSRCVTAGSQRSGRRFWCQRACPFFARYHGETCDLGREFEVVTPSTSTRMGMGMGTTGWRKRKGGTLISVT